MLLRTLLISSFLAGCAAQPSGPLPPPEILIKYIRPDCGTPPSRAPVVLRSISWQIIGGRFTLSPDGYEDLSYNVTMILQAAEELNIEIKYYEDCVDVGTDTEDG